MNARIVVGKGTTNMRKCQNFFGLFLSRRGDLHFSSRRFMHLSRRFRFFSQRFMLCHSRGTIVAQMWH
ncbi:MAG: hypothetical protein Q4D23_07645, partial [Bacteroidales bacterium]|nr:hypothetical protein [Bacteroidales bacterium]